MDALSAITRILNLHDAAFAAARFDSPWHRHVPEAPADGRAPDHVLHYYFAVEGDFEVSVHGEPVRNVGAGEAVVLARGDTHVIASRGGAGHVVCGSMRCDAWLRRSIFDFLPRIMSSSLRGDPDAAWIEHAIQGAAQSSLASRLGGRGMVSKLSELLLVHILSGHLRALEDAQPGWARGLGDPIIGRSLAALHDRPAHPWTVEDLAKNVGASRSALAQRFTELVGVPPMHYLAKWRMALAADYLRRSSLSLLRIAEEVGYDTAAAFNRAFVREFGVPPATWRRNLAYA